jgi:hypothetical protein
MTMIAAAVVGGAVSILGGAFGAISGNQRAKAAAREKRRANREIAKLEAGRQDIINPWATTSNLSYLATSTVENITNSYNNLGVATQASEFQAEQADISLANTLDTLRSTGASAGGATALAQAALQSKKGVSASLEAQEAQTQKLRAQGQMESDRFNAQAKMSDAQRIQSLQIAEGQRVQANEASGAQFMFNTRENRTNARLDRLSGQSTNYANQEMAARQDQTAAVTGAISAVGDIAGSYMAGSAEVQAGTGKAYE